MVMKSGYRLLMNTNLLISYTILMGYPGVTAGILKLVTKLCAISAANKSTSYWYPRPSYNFQEWMMGKAKASRRWHCFRPRALHSRRFRQTLAKHRSRHDWRHLQKALEVGIWSTRYYFSPAPEGSEWEDYIVVCVAWVQLWALL